MKNRNRDSVILSQLIKNLIGISLDLLQFFGIAVKFQKKRSEFGGLMVALNILRKVNAGRKAVQLAYFMVSCRCCSSVAECKGAFPFDRLGRSTLLD